MNIQVETIVPDPNRLSPGIYLVSGLPKHGKTSGAVAFNEKGTDGTLLIDMDWGGDEIACNRLLAQSINAPVREVVVGGKMEKTPGGATKMEIIPYEERSPKAYSLSEILKWLKDGGGEQYTTGVLDTVNVLNEWSEVETCQKLDIRAMGEGEYGADWATARNRVAQIIKKFEEIFVRQRNGYLILLAHSKQSNMLSKEKQRSPQLPAGLVTKLSGMCKSIGFISMKNGEHPLVSFENPSEVIGGSRIAALHHVELPWDYKALKEHVEKYEVKDES
jgi:hypothetical protein